MSRQTEPGVSREDRGAVAVLTIGRAAGGDSSGRSLIDSLADALDRIAVGSGVRSVVLAGLGGGFDQGAEPGRSEVADAQALGDLIDRVHKFPRPVVSAVEGDAEGPGAALALAADLVVMGESARIGFPEVSRGLVAALAVPDLVRQVGDRRARELLLTGRLVGSEAALAWGLVNRVVASGSVVGEAVRLAEETASAGPVALATTKHLLDESTQRPKTLRGSAAISAAVSDSDEAREGAEAAQEDRPPGWRTGEVRSRPPDDRRDGGTDPDLPGPS